MITETCLRVLGYDKICQKLAALTLTSLGKKLALDLQPSFSLDDVKILLQKTQEAQELLLLEKELPISSFRDLREILQRARIGAVLEAVQLLEVYNTLLATNRVKNYIANSELESCFLRNLSNELVLLPNLEKIIVKSISDSGLVKDDASNELSSIRNKISIFKNRVKERLEGILRSSEYQKYFQEQIVTIRSDRYVIPVKQEYRQFFPGIIHDQSSSGATVFVEPMAIVNLNNDIKKLMLDEKQEVERILTVISKEVAAVATSLSVNLDILAELDLIFAKARLALKTKANCPEITQSTAINIIQGRHPLIEPETVVPLDIVLDKSVKTLLITGPNTGGKTVSIKLVGLFSLMAQSGMFILAEKYSSLPFYTNIFADIGDEQSIEQSLSTFSAHMTNIIRILETVNSSSLVLLDELCAGTDPSEGAALAKAILQHLQACSANTLVSTHYNELKLMALDNPEMLNASVEFDKISLRPTYRLILGVAGSSNAFYISQRLGLAEPIIEQARAFLNTEQVRFTEALQGLEDEKANLQLANQEIKETQERIRRLESKLVLDKQNLKEREDNLLSKARKEAEQIKRKAKLDVEQIIKNIKQLEKETSQQVKNRVIKEARENLANEWVVEQPKDATGEILTSATAQLGLTVFVNTLGQKGSIVAIKGAEVQVQIGIMKMHVKMKDCQLVRQGKIENNVPKLRKITEKSLQKLKNFKSEIDIRGLNVQEAIVELDKYLDDAVLVNMPNVRIIHGKGTGQLKKGVEEYLQAHPSVKGFTEAAISEGGAGATIVSL